MSGCGGKKREKKHVYAQLKLFAGTLQVTLSTSIHHLNASNANVKDLKRKGLVFVALQSMEMHDFDYELFMFRSKLGLENWHSLGFFSPPLVILYVFDSDLTGL